MKPKNRAVKSAKPPEVKARFTAAELFRPRYISGWAQMGDNERKEAALKSLGYDIKDIDLDKVHMKIYRESDPTLYLIGIYA